MDLLHELRKSRQSAASALQWFLIEYPKSPQAVFVFLENQDDPSFYTGFIGQFVSDLQNIKIYKCGNKDEVYNTHEKIMERVPSQATVLFFVDKDLSDIIQENRIIASNIYVTDWYSIENYLVTNDMFLRVWNENFRITDQEELIEINEKNFLEIFQKELNNFHSLITPIMAWIIYIRKNKYRANLNNIKLSNIYKFNESLNINAANGKLTTIDLIEKYCNIQVYKQYREEIDLICLHLEKLNPKTYIRGKFEVWFFVNFLNQLIKTLRISLNNYKGRVSITVDITENNFITFLAPRLPIPQSLHDFLQRNIQLS